MLDSTDVVVPNHPMARKYNHLGGAVDVKTHNWVHSNIKFRGEPQEYKPIKDAFTTLDPWHALGYVPDRDCPTLSVSRWSYRDSPVAKHDGSSLWVSMESLHQAPYKFVQHVANKYRITVDVSTCPTYSIRWVDKTFQPE